MHDRSDTFFASVFGDGDTLLFLSFSGYKENLRHHCQRLHLHILVVFTLTRCFGFLFSSYAGLLVMLSLANLLLNASFRTVSFESAQSTVKTLVIFNNYV